jgi:hypothetical protein
VDDNLNTNQSSENSDTKELMASINISYFSVEIN